MWQGVCPSDASSRVVQISLNGFVCWGGRLCTWKEILNIPGRPCPRHQHAGFCCRKISWRACVRYCSHNTIDCVRPGNSNDLTGWLKTGCTYTSMSSISPMSMCSAVWLRVYRYKAQIMVWWTTHPSKLARLMSARDDSSKRDTSIRWHSAEMLSTMQAISLYRSTSYLLARGVVQGCEPFQVL